MTTTPSADIRRKKIEKKIELYRVHLGSSAPARKYREGRCLLPLSAELHECRRALLRNHGKSIPKDMMELSKAASMLRRSLSAKTSPRRLAAVTSRLSSVRADMMKTAGNPSARAALVSKAPEVMLPTDPRELIANQWAALGDPKAKTAFFRKHQAALRSWLREIEGRVQVRD
jgi:hypothetical protein